MTEVITQTAKFWLGDDGIIYAQPTARREQTLDDALENSAALARIAGGSRKPVLVYFQEAPPQSAECRAHYASEAALVWVSAVAFVTSSMLGRVIGNLMIGMNKTAVPLRLFAEERDALAWLEEVRSNPVRLKVAR